MDDVTHEARCVRGGVPPWKFRSATRFLALAILLVTGTAAASGPFSAGMAGGDSTGAGSTGGTVSVGATNGAGTPGSGASGGGLPGGGGESGSGSWSCVYTYLAINNEGGFPNGGPTPGAWYSVTCVDPSTGAQVTQTVWVTSSSPAAPSIDPASVAVLAENAMRLPDPEIGLDPRGTSVVNLPTWLWVAPSLWHADTVTANADGVSATAVAEPVAVVWSTGDGGRVECAGPGVAYNPSIPSGGQATDCFYEYRETSAGQPSVDGNSDDAAFTVSATVVWSVSWTSAGVAGGGVLPTLFTSSAVPLRVVQVESVNDSSAATPGMTADSEIGNRQ